MKRKLTLFLSAVMATSCLPMTAYAANFKDINDVPWAGASAVINSVADRGLLSGYDDGTFRARNNVTYCEAMQMVYTTMTKTGKANFDAATVYSYMSVLDTYKVPKWAQMAVAYGLSEGILDMQMVVTNFAGGTKAATRADVAKMFGNAVTAVYGKERDTSDAEKFTDYWSIPVTAVEQVSVLRKMGIVNGDEYNRFNPQKNINRAEMAVMLNKTYDVLAEGLTYTGELIEVSSNRGNDGTAYYYVMFEAADKSYKCGFNLKEGQIPVYDGNNKISMSKLSKGDEVEAVISGLELISLRVLDATTNQEKYDVTGYLRSLKEKTLTIENENTGETDRYQLDGKTECYLDGEKINQVELADFVKEHYKDFIYIGMNIEEERVRDDDTKEWSDRTRVRGLYLTLQNEYSVIGEIDTLRETHIAIKMEGSSALKQYSFTEDCKFYIGDEEVDYSEVEKMNDEQTTYVKVMVNKDSKAYEVIVSEDSFASPMEKEESETYKLAGLSEDKMILTDGDERITYDLEKKHPLKNIQFYTWDGIDESWDEVSVEKAEKYADQDEFEYEDKNGDRKKKEVEYIYVKIGFNSGGKLRQVYLSADKDAWKNSDDHETERSGIVASIKDDVLMFEGSSVKYTLLKDYKEEGLLYNKSMEAQTKNVLYRMANDSDIELYAEIVANGDMEIREITTRIKKAEGTLIEFDAKEKIFEIETADGNTFKLKSMAKPELVDEIEDWFELDDIEGPNSNYVGDNVILEFGGSGTVNRVSVESMLKTNDVSERISGTAVSADSHGLKLKGDSKTYRWNSDPDKVQITNYSSDRDAIGTIIKMIEDPDVEVYIEARLDEYPNGWAIDVIDVYVRSAEGTLSEFDDDVRIKTDAGNTFTFHRVNKLTTCDVNGYGQEELKDTDKGEGAYVKLDFNKNGYITSVES
ncbi:MAG: S-layer homology domain-containing protein [Anaerotignum sp.]|nr:S-layer homology domain-containing protein [Anaerotignum sp.]